MDAELTITRREHLAAAVVHAMDLSAVTPMRWGVDDCALWCANAIREVLGYDPATSFRGRYADCDQANNVLGKTGLLGALRRAAKAHRWRQIAPSDAQAGDIGLAIVTGPHGRMIQTCMICRAPGWFVARNETGFTAIASQYVARAWAVL